MTREQALAISKELHKGNHPRAEEALRAKCNWEAMTRTAVILEWGDPRTWQHRPDA